MAFLSIYTIFGNPLSSELNPIIKNARVEDGVKIFQGSPFYPILQYFILFRAFIYLNMFLAIPIWFLEKKLSITMMFCALFSCVVLDVSWGSRTLLLDSFIMLAIFFY